MDALQALAQQHGLKMGDLKEAPPKIPTAAADFQMAHFLAEEVDEEEMLDDAELEEPPSKQTRTGSGTPAAVDVEMGSVAPHLQALQDRPGTPGHTLGTP